jgi:hypothetical protein
VSNNLSGDQRVILLSAVRDIVRRATENRAQLPAADPRRHFYLGVERAANEVLMPELAAASGGAWLERETCEFREGYLRMVTVLSDAVSAPQPPIRLLLPEPQEIPQ